MIENMEFLGIGIWGSYLDVVKYFEIRAGYLTKTSVDCIGCLCHLVYKGIKIFAWESTTGSQQQHITITVGPYYLTHRVNFPCGREPEYPEKTHER